jgi:hypothetical protein
LNLPEKKQSLEPKAPVILQNLKWLQLNAWNYRGLVLVALLIMLFGAIGSLVIKPLFDRDALSRRNSVSKAKAFLAPHEEPSEILAILSQYPGPTRAKQAKALFIDHWLQRPWTGTIRGVPMKEERGWSFTLETSISNSHGVCVNTVRTEQDASSLRDGVEVSVTGRIAADLENGLRIDRATFEILSPTH